MAAQLAEASLPVPAQVDTQQLFNSLLDECMAKKTKRPVATAPKQAAGQLLLPWPCMHAFIEIAAQTVVIGSSQLC